MEAVAGHPVGAAPAAVVAVAMAVQPPMGRAAEALGGSASDKRNVRPRDEGWESVFRCFVCFSFFSFFFFSFRILPTCHSFLKQADAFAQGPIATAAG